MPSGFKKYFSNTLWMVGGRLLKAAVNFAVGILVARYLGAGRFGALNYALGVVMLFSIFAAMGLDNILVRELVGKEAWDQKTILGSAIALRLLGSALATLVTMVFLKGTNADAETSVLILICTVTFLFMPCEIFRSYFEASVDGRTIVIVDLMQTLISSGLRIYFIVVQQSVFWFAMCWVSEWIFAAIGFLIFYRCKRGGIFTWRFRKAVFLNLFKESLPLLISAMAIVVYQQFDKIMLKNMLLENGNDQVGLYSAALRIIPFVVLVPQMVAKALIPSLVNVKKHDQEKYRERSQLFLDLMTWLGISLSAVLFLLADPIIALYGADYAEAGGILKVVAWKGVFLAMSISSGLLIVTEGIQKWAVLRNVSGCLINIVLNWLWIPDYGAIGSAWATLVSFAIASYLAHMVIPLYRQVFVMQTKSLTGGIIRILKISKFRSLGD